MTTRSIAVSIDGGRGRASAGPSHDRPFVQNAILGGAGIVLGRRFSAALRGMQDAELLSPSELQMRSERRLAVLLEHAARSVPFYRRQYRRLGVAANAFRTIADLQALPIMTKHTYRSGALDEFLAVDVPAHRRLARSTSGSTGQPFAFYLDRRALPVIFASHLYYDSCFGLGPFDRQVRITSPPAAAAPLPADTPFGFRIRQGLTTRLQRLYERLTQRRLPVWGVDAERAEQMWRDLETFRPAAVMGYTSTLAEIAGELLARGRPLARPPRVVVTIGETLSPARRALIEQYFEAPIVNRYGLRELGSWSAQSCLDAGDRFHVNTELVVCEVVREDGSPAAPGETGRVVLTDLHNDAMPFIRYDTGDLAIAESGLCTCGRGWPLLGAIDGRSQESVRTPSGKVIAPTVLGHYLFVYNGHLEHVRHYQLIQEARDRARLLVVPAGQWDASRHRRLRDDVARLLGEDMSVAVEAVAEIPLERSGKRPIIKSVVDTGRQQ